MATPELLPEAFSFTPPGSNILPPADRLSTPVAVMLALALAVKLPVVEITTSVPEMVVAGTMMLEMPVRVKIVAPELPRFMFRVGLLLLIVTLPEVELAVRLSARVFSDMKPEVLDSCSVLASTRPLPAIDPAMLVMTMPGAYTVLLGEILPAIVSMVTVLPPKTTPFVVILAKEKEGGVVVSSKIEPPATAPRVVMLPVSAICTAPVAPATAEMTLALAALSWIKTPPAPLVKAEICGMPVVTCMLPVLA